MMPAVDDKQLRSAFGHFPSGVVAVCGLSGGKPQGMAASSFTGVSLDPPLVSFCVRNESATWRELSGLERLGVSFLGASHGQACRQLAGRAESRFDNIEWRDGERGAVYIDEACVWLECAVERRIPAGDHEIVLLRIERLQIEPGIDPLVFHGSRFTTLVAPC